MYLARLYTSDKNCNNLWMYTCMYQQFISDDTSTRSIIKKHNKQNSIYYMNVYLYGNSCVNSIPNVPGISGHKTWALSYLKIDRAIIHFLFHQTACSLVNGRHGAQIQIVKT